MTAVQQPRRTRQQINEENVAARDALIEDLMWMAQHGEHIAGAAARVDKSISALEAWLRDKGRTDIWHRLQANAPLVK